MNCSTCKCVLEDYEIQEFEFFKKVYPESTQEPQCSECVDEALGLNE